MRALRSWLLWTICPLLLLAPSLAHGQTLSAMWDPNPSSDAIVGYEVCIGTTSLSCNFELATVAASENSYTFSPNPGVLYRVAVRAINAAGPGPYSAEVVTSIPGLTQPANQTSTVNQPISPLSLSATDPDGGIIQFTHSGLPFGLSLNQATGIITGTPTSPGTFNVIIFVSDGIVTTSRTFVWTVNSGSGGDTTAPTLSITSHTPNQSVGASSIVLAGTATDSGAGGSGITSVTVNGAAATGGSASGSTTANWSATVGLVVGGNTISVVATDGAGNVRTSSIAINRTNPDVTAPTLSITSHTSGQTVSSASITLSGTATDSGAGGSGISNVTVNGTSASGSAASGNNTANWSRNLTLALGANTITVVATDGAGNQRTTPITITYAVSAVTSVTLSANVASPAVPGTPITFMAAASGGVGPRQYKFLVQQGGGAAQVARDWSASTSFAWTPTTAASYIITVWARSAGVTTDAAQAQAQSNFTIAAVLGAPTLTPSLSSPQNTGTTVTFTAGASGGATPYSYKWWVQYNGTWTMVQSWSTSPTYTFTPSAAGDYRVGIWVRGATTTADTDAVNLSIPFTVTTPAPAQAPPTPPSNPTNALSSPTLTPDLSSPRNTGTTVTFTAGASGGTAPYSYKWWVLFNGSWTMVRDWNTSPNFSWTPSTAGDYRVGIWVRSANTTADTSAVNLSIPYTVTTAPAAPTPPTPPTNALTSPTLTPDLSSPRNTGTTVTFTAGASGGTAPYSYKWWVLFNGSWTMVRDWSTSPTFAWTPSSTGDYRVGIWVRSANTTADTSSVNLSIPYVVTNAPAPPTPPTPPAPPTNVLTATGVTPDLSSPQNAGATVTFTASASGGTGPYSYKWWVLANGTWTMARDWSTSPTYSWTPLTPGSYRIGIWVRDSTTTADTSAVNLSVAYTVTGSPAPPVLSNLRVTNIVTNVGGAASVGQTVTATASASGGSAPYQFKWWMFDGTTWVMARDWGSDTLTFTPSAANANRNFRLGVWVRSAGVIEDTGAVNFSIALPILP